MKINDLFEKWGLGSINVNVFGFAEFEFVPQDVDKIAAWQLYVELATRIATQPLEDDFGDEKMALESIKNVFDITRSILKDNGRKCLEFSKLAIIMLNRDIRPFTSKWHKKSCDGAFQTTEGCVEFREDLKLLQDKLIKYSNLFSRIACVEDMTNM